ncbi:MAG: serine hydrolase [Gammaproteobacteria bacterium]|nr:serine hydrolase [Gammaproteobacteria bacterium]
MRTLCQCFFYISTSIALLTMASACQAETDNSSIINGVSVYYPPLVGDEWQAIDSRYGGWDKNKLEKTVEFVGENKSTAFLIIQKGRIVSENYWQGWNQHSRDIIYSASKTIVAFLLGKRLEQGLINSIDDPMSDYLGAGWLTLNEPGCRNYPHEHELTIRHAITMTSGLRESLLFNRIHCIGWVTADSEWNYNTMVYRKAIDIIAKDLNNTDQLNKFSHDVLFNKIGMQHTDWIIEDYRLQSSARDMARFGLMMLYGGQWNGEDIVQDKQYLQQMLSSANPFNLSYGYLTWLNGKSKHMLPRDKAIHDGPFIPQAPADMYMALGHGDKKIYVVPSLHLVVVRHGPAAYRNDLALTQFDKDLWQRLCAANSRCIPAASRSSGIQSGN